MRDISLYENVPPLKNNFSVKIKEYSDYKSLRAHWHEHIELLYFLDGEGEMWIGGESVRVGKDDLAVVNSSEVHSFVASVPLRYICVLIYPAFFSDVDVRGVRIKTKVSGDEYVRESFYNMMSESGSDDPAADMMLKSYTYSLMAYLVRAFSVPNLSDEEFERGNRQLLRLSSVIERINSSYKERLSTRELARAAYMTESHFCRFFKRMTGVSAVKYINDLRVERASVLLLETEAPITEIAAAVGFLDVNYFSRVFRAVRGVSPCEYRKNMKG